MTSRRVRIHSAGGHEQLCVEGFTPRDPAPGEVHVRVRHAGVNYADCVVRMGLYASAKEYVGWPITPGFEVAGTVARVGEGVTDLAVGDEVLAVTRFDGYASDVVVPRWQVFRRPAALTSEQAAAFPAVGMTAWWALFELAHPRPGATVLVHSAAGGVGSMLVQLAKIAGARVVAVVGATHKVEAARALGADVVIDKSQEPLWKAAEAASPRGYDVVLDANGVSTLKDSWNHLAPAGKLVVYGFHSMLPKQGGRPSWPSLAWDWLRTPRFNPLDMTTSNRSVLAFNLSFLLDRQEILAEAAGQLVAWLAEGRLEMPAVQAFPVEKVADAHRAIESGTTVGKLVLAF